MIIIKNIDYIEVKESTFRIATDNPFDHFRCIENGEPGFMSKMNVTDELIQGIPLSMPDGTKVFLGISNKATKALGMSYERMKYLEDKCSDLATFVHCVKKENNEYKDIAESRRKLSFFTRLKWLFTGVK